MIGKACTFLLFVFHFCFQFLLAFLNYVLKTLTSRLKSCFVGFTSTALTRYVIYLCYEIVFTIPICAQPEN